MEKIANLLTENLLALDGLQTCPVKPALSNTNCFHISGNSIIQIIYNVKSLYDVVDRNITLITSICDGDIDSFDSALIGKLVITLY